MANTNFPLEISKSRRIKGFGEDISQLSLGVCISSLYLLSLHGLSGSGVFSQHVSCFCEKLNFVYRDGTGVIAH
jgi:hypothetical protein